MSLADYLAKNYLTADAKPEKRSKKRKRKDGSAPGLIIAEDDATGWEKHGFDRNDDEDGPLTGTYAAYSAFEDKGPALTRYRTQSRAPKPPNFDVKGTQVGNRWGVRCPQMQSRQSPT